MNRDDATSLLRELMAAFTSLGDAPIVSIAKDKESGSWELSIKWISVSTEKAFLNGIANKHGFTVTETDGYTVFR